MTSMDVRKPVISRLLHERTKLPSSKWDQLKAGHRVVVQRPGGPLLPGEVDVISPDASVFWVWLDGGRGRIAVHMDDKNTGVWLPTGSPL